MLLVLLSVLGCWDVGLLGFWVVGVLACWVTGLLGHIDWVVGGWVVFFALVVFSVFGV